MNNIRKMIEERLENAKYDYECHKHTNLKDSPIIVSLKSEIQTYQDCLNLFPAPRTEQEILNDFEKLGYKVKFNNASMLYLTNDYDVTIHINKLFKGYRRFYDNEIANYITIQEHKLLNELFICWRWL